MHELDDLCPGGALVPLELEPGTPLIVPAPDDGPTMLALLTSEVFISAGRRGGLENPCRVYWGSHGCHLERGHDPDCECDCCECENHPDPDPDNPGCAPSCVAKAPYYGPETRFYGEDAAARGLPQLQVQ
jgi:hypothetical protein